MRTCKHEGCSNQRRAFEYSCLPCKRVKMVARIARELMVEMVGGKDRMPSDLVHACWELAEELVCRMEDELGYMV